MRNEGDLNRFLTKEIKKIPRVMVVKASDKYTPGISDFLLWKDGRGAFLETKFVTKLPNLNRLLLRHRFSSKQVGFLKGMTNMGGCPAWGAIAIGDEKTLYCFPSWHIPSEGNWKTEEFLRIKSSIPDPIYDHTKPRAFKFTEVCEMIKQLFLEESKPIYKGPYIHVD